MASRRPAGWAGSAVSRAGVAGPPPTHLAHICRDAHGKYGPRPLARHDCTARRAVRHRPATEGPSPCDGGGPRPPGSAGGGPRSRARAGGGSAGPRSRASPPNHARISDRERGPGASGDRAAADDGGHGLPSSRPSGRQAGQDSTAGNVALEGGHSRATGTERATAVPPTPHITLQRKVQPRARLISEPSERFRPAARVVEARSLHLGSSQVLRRFSVGSYSRVVR
jgi:hypothetical protein